MNRQQIGTIIRQQRRNKDYSQAKLAQQLNTEPQRIHEVEKGLTNITIDRLISICNVLDLNIEINPK